MAIFETGNLRIEHKPDGVAILWLDVQDKSVNVFNRQVLADLEEALDKVAAEPGCKVLVIRSAKPSGFIAGADIGEFTTITDASHAAALSANGQRIFGKLEALAIPTVAVIQGACLGGGLELALACDYRLVVDHPRTQLGLPEVELGILPAWGGTQRLPRIVGLEKALSLILAARRVTARDALRLGLADHLVSSEAEVAGELTRLIARARQQGKRMKARLPLRTWRQRLVESNPIGRWLIFRGAERVLAERVPDDMPAPHEALNAVRTGVTRSMEAGLAFEREAVGRLMTTPACRHLVGLFLQREAARKPAEANGKAIGPIQGIGIVGAGTMGAAIAQLAVVKGYQVVVQEVNEAALNAGFQRITGLMNKAVERKILSAEHATQKLAAMGRTTTWEGFADVDVVIEAAIEEPTAKQAIFAELGRRTSPTAILATNTSSLSVERLQEGVDHPERVAGMHFFNPVHKMPLVEVVRTPRTTDRAIAVLTQLASALGKTPVVVKDSPGFVVNRILMPYLNEAVLLAAEGMPIDRIDQTMRRFGMPMGPLELLDQVGLDVAAHVARSTQPSDSRQAPSTAFEQMVARGWLGQKSGWGFYNYQGRQKKLHYEAAVMLASASAAHPDHSLSSLAAAVQSWEARERLVLLMVNEAAACLGEGLAESAETIDLAMVLGTGWAPHRGGPLHYADDRGLAQVVAALEQLIQRCGPRYEPPAELRRRASAGESFCRHLHPVPT